MGDATDGYGGCPGIGPKTAEKLLDKHGAVWKTVVDAYLKAGLTEEDAIMNARMARILRAEDWDFENNEVKLWTP
jgi:DNA polymerase-1